MLEMINGCKVPRCDLLTEQCERTEYGFLANVNASKIKGLMRDFLLRQTSPVFLVLELPTNKFAERPLRQNDQAPMHKDVYYLDGLAIDDAVALLDKYGELLVHDGLSNFGFGAHDATAEIMLGKYNIVNLFAKDANAYQEFLSQRGIPLVPDCLTAWDTFNHAAPGEAWLYKLDGKSVYDVAEELKSRGLYFAERREDW